MDVTILVFKIIARNDFQYESSWVEVSQSPEILSVVETEKKFKDGYFDRLWDLVYDISNTV
jgi:hypothetical protein